MDHMLSQVSIIRSRDNEVFSIEWIQDAVVMKQCACCGNELKITARGDRGRVYQCKTCQTRQRATQAEKGYFCNIDYKDIVKGTWIICDHQEINVIGPILISKSSYGQTRIEWRQTTNELPPCMWCGYPVVTKFHMTFDGYSASCPRCHERCSVYRGFGTNFYSGNTRLRRIPRTSWVVALTKEL